MKISRREFMKGFGVLTAGALFDTGPIPDPGDPVAFPRLQIRLNKIESVVWEDIYQLRVYGVSGREYEVGRGDLFDAIIERFF
jgi:hypothetical protein